MNPELLEKIGDVIVALLASSRDGISTGAVALLSVANDLVTLLRGGVVHDVGEAKDSLLENMRARVEDRRAGALLKKATAFKTVAEAVRLTTATAPPSVSREQSPVNSQAALDRFREALTAFSLMGGRLLVDPKNLEEVEGTLAALLRTNGLSAGAMHAEAGSIELVGGASAGSSSANAKLDAQTSPDPDA